MVKIYKNRDSKLDIFYNNELFQRIRVDKIYRDEYIESNENV